MDDPNHPVIAADQASPAYQDDAYGWAMAQVALIRERNVDQIDWDKIAEEIEDVGLSQRDALESALRLLMMHLLKWEHQPAFRSRSWLLTIREQHRQFERRLMRNPGLKSSLEEIRSEAYRQAVVDAQAETGMEIGDFPTDPLGWNIIHNPAVHEDDIRER